MTVMDRDGDEAVCKQYESHAELSEMETVANALDRCRNVLRTEAWLEDSIIIQY